MSGEGRPLDEGEEADLVERARRGDVGAYEVLVGRYQDQAGRVAHVIAGADGDDAVQDAFVKAFHAMARFRPGAPFRPWLLRIVANEARNRRRSAGRRAGLALRVARQRPSGDAAPSPEEAAIAGERRRRLADALATLNERDRLIVAYRYMGGMTEAEMAEALGCAPGTVKSRLSRALDRLRAALDEPSLEVEVADA